MAKSDSTTEKKKPTTEEMVNILRLVVLQLSSEIQKLKGDHDPLTIDQREIPELLGFETTAGGIILDEEFDQIIEGDISLDLDAKTSDQILLG